MAKTATQAELPPLAPREVRNSVADVIRMRDVTDQRARDIRDRIDDLDTAIQELYREKIELTRELASVWSAT